MPGPIGGASRSFQQLTRELEARDDVEAEIVDINRGEGPLGVADALLVLRVVGRTLVRGARADVLTFHASTRGTALFGPLMRALAAIVRKPLLVREFGGSLDRDLELAGPVTRGLAHMALRADRLLLQTRNLVAHFEQVLPETPIAWFPTSRPVPEAPPDPDRPRAGRFAFVGHVKATKGIGEILEAAASLPPDQGVDVFGPFHDGMDESVFEGQDRVNYHGVLETDAVIPTLGRYDALLLPTYHAGEGYPGILLEAYAAGIPVVVSRWRAIPEIVEDGETGLIVEPRDAAGLAAALQRLATDDDLLRALRRGARKASDRFRSTEWTQAFVDHCRELAEARRA